DGVPEARPSRPDVAHSVQRPKAGEAREQSTSLRAADAAIPSAPSTAPSLTERRADPPAAKASGPGASEPAPRKTPSTPPTSARPSQPSTLPGAGARGSSPPGASQSTRPSSPPS